jgi:hypothetical protein
MFADISDYKNLSDFLPIIAGVLVTEWSFIFAARKIFGVFINKWYTDFGIYALMSDAASITIGILLARYFYDYFFDEWSLFNFVLLAVGIQVIHDILFYIFIIQTVKKGQNGIIDILKPYAADAGWRAIPGDSWMMIASAILASYFKTLPEHIQSFILVASVYILPYAIFEKRG